jgi:hypothetical protein
MILSCGLATPALAQEPEWPDLIGTWTGTSRSVVSADGGHFTGGDGAGPRFAEVAFTIEWTQQDRGRYIGTVTSNGSTEPKMAVKSAAGDLFVTVDEDGQSIGRLLDENRFELCYTQSSQGDPQSVASCVLFTRQ